MTAGGGQLDRQRQPVQPAQISATAGAFASVSAKSGADRLGALDEQRAPPRTAPAASSGGSALGVGQRQRRHRELVLAAQTCSTRAAGDQELQRGQAASSSATDGGGVEHLLEVVQHQQQLLVAQVVRRAAPAGGCAAALAHAQRLGDRGATSAGSRIGASATKQTPSAKSSSQLGGHLEARRVLPMPPGPVSVSRRTSGRRSSWSADGVDLPLAADQRRGLGRQVVRAAARRAQAAADRPRRRRPGANTARAAAGSTRRRRAQSRSSGGADWERIWARRRRRQDNLALAGAGQQGLGALGGRGRSRPSAPPPGIGAARPCRAAGWPWAAAAARIAPAQHSSASARPPRSTAARSGRAPERPPTRRACPSARSPPADRGESGEPQP